MEDKNLPLSGEDAVKTALEKLRDRPKPRTSTGGSSIMSNASNAEKLINFNNKEEETPLVATNKGYESYPARLANPTTEYDIDSADQFSERQSKKTSNFATMMHLLKGNIGTGILAMPSAVSNAGLLVGTLGIPVLGVVCVHCMHLLVNSSKTLARRVGLSSLDYANTAENAFRHGPSKVQPLAKVARFAVNTMLMLTQFGFCCVYFLFVASSIHEVVFSLTKKSPLNVKEYMAILLPVMILFNFIRNLKALSPASSIANILQISGLFMVFYYLLTDIPPIDSVPLSNSWSKLPLYFGTAMYAFEGIGVVLPLENSMETPDDFGGLNGVLNTAMVIVTCLYTGVGFYGYLKYGDKVKGSITFNLDAPIVSEIIRIMFATAIFLSYALQFYVPIEIIWPTLKRKFSLDRFSSGQQLMMEYVCRAVLVVITCVLAIAIPKLDLFISLVGALASSSLALIFPPIIEVVTIWNSSQSKTRLYVTVVKDTVIVILGIMGSILGTYVTVLEIIGS